MVGESIRESSTQRLNLYNSFLFAKIISTQIIPQTLTDVRPYLSFLLIIDIFLCELAV
jgi:hypothetical protein